MASQQARVVAYTLGSIVAVGVEVCRLHAARCRLPAVEEEDLHRVSNGLWLNSTSSLILDLPVLLKMRPSRSSSRSSADIPPIIGLSVGYAVLILLSAGFNYLQILWLQTIAQRIIQQMRMKQRFATSEVHGKNTGFGHLLQAAVEHVPVQLLVGIFPAVAVAAGEVAAVVDGPVDGEGGLQGQRFSIMPHRL